MDSDEGSGVEQSVGDNRPYRVSFRLSEDDVPHAVYFLYFDASGGALGKDVTLHDETGRLLFTNEPDKLPGLLRHGKKEFLALGPPRDEPVVEHSVAWTVRLLSGKEPADRDDEAYCTLTMLCDCLATIDPDDRLGFRKVLGRGFSYLFENGPRYSPEAYKDDDGDPEGLLRSFYGALGFVLCNARLVL